MGRQGKNNKTPSMPHTGKVWVGDAKVYCYTRANETGLLLKAYSEWLAAGFLKVSSLSQKKNLLNK